MMDVIAAVVLCCDPPSRLVPARAEHSACGVGIGDGVDTDTYDK